VVNKGVEPNSVMLARIGALTLSAVDFAIVAQSGVLPKPCGVAATIVQL
jgi:hypothetical protein